MFFHQIAPPGPIRGTLGWFRFFPKICGDIRQKVVSAVYDTLRNGNTLVYHTPRNGDLVVYITWRNDDSVAYDMMTKYAQVPDFKIVCSGHARSYFTYSTSRSWFNCCEDADNSFMLLSWWCPFKMKKENGRPDSLKISIDRYHFRPLLATVGQNL